jgi:hypothetical protein
VLTPPPPLLFAATSLTPRKRERKSERPVSLRDGAAGVALSAALAPRRGER